ncbi:MAG: Gfo/Idh/MocA family oxidoreductase [Clostridia bacterium]|nr:Gfo/Idh/MocA family oxidoreductase [Clostridia bacterium]
MNKKVRFGAVGASGMGMAHIRSIAHHPSMELVAVCDKDPARLEVAKKEVVCPAYYTDWHDLINDPNVEAVVLCVPDRLHLEMTEAALKAGKQVLCEKPMALTVEECEQMRAAEKKYGQRLMIGQICRYAPAFQLAKKLVDRGEIGELYYVESEYAHDYAKARGADDWRVDPLREPFLGGGCHAVDLLRWIAGDPYEISAFANHKCLTDWPVNDCTVAIMRFPNEVLGKVFVSIGCKRDYTMRSCFYGTKGTIICDNTSNHITVFKAGMKEKDPLFAEKTDHTIPIQIPVKLANHNTYGELGDFAQCILEGKPVPTSAYDSERSVVVCLAAAESAKLGKNIEIHYPKEDL